MLDTIAPPPCEDREARRRRRLDAFQPAYVRPIQALTASSDALEDLADSFPALLFAFATGYGTETRRAQAIALVRAGRPLREASEALGLPWWLRRLPAGAFSAPLCAVPDHPAFAAAIVDLVPPGVTQARRWLARVLEANACCHQGFALWTGRHYRASPLPSDDTTFYHLAGWAWHGDQPGTPGFPILRRPWSLDIGMRRALEEMGVWRRRAELAFCLDPRAGEDWVEDGTANGYEFVALRTIEDFLAEAEAMGNCLDQFADHMGSGATRVISIRRNGRRIADVEIGVRDRAVGVPEILQLKANRNRRAPPELWQATYAWLGSQPLGLVRVEPGTAALRRCNRKAFWTPFLDSLAKPDRERVEPFLVGEAGRPSLLREAARAMTRHGLLAMLTSRIEQRQ
jgi:hypothetical protein